jgi:hypothetical protein
VVQPKFTGKLELEDSSENWKKNNYLGRWMKLEVQERKFKWNLEEGKQKLSGDRD